MSHVVGWRGFFAGLLGLLFGQLGRAEEKIPMPKESAPKQVQPVDGTAIVHDANGEEVPQHRLARLRPTAVKERVQGRWEGRVDKWKTWKDTRTPIGCYSNFNHYTCSSLHSTCAFMFGGCRTFFGEACLKGPPPSPVPGFDESALGLDRRGGCKNCP